MSSKTAQWLSFLSSDLDTGVGSQLHGK